MQSSSSALTRRDWLLIVVVWLLAIGMMVIKQVQSGGGTPLFLDTDDAMRMVVVRDFLHGQGWYDLIQHRLNTPYGAEIHWSRLVDVPIAAILFLAQLVTNPDMTIVVTGWAWPLILLFVLLWLSARLTKELVGSEGLLPALVLPILNPAVMGEFSAGRVDHHSVIILLTLGCLFASLVAQRRSIAAWIAGIIAATALAVAIEAIPLIAAAVLAFGLAYVVNPARAANLRRFGLGFGGGMVVHLILVRTPDRWLEAACDMISPVYVLAGLAVGAAYLIASLVPAPRHWALRLVLLGVLGSLAVGLVVLVYPQCLAGPYGNLDPWLQENWIARITEARPWHESLIDLPVYSIVVGVPVFLGLVVTLVALWRDRERRMLWLITLVFLGCATLVMLAQIRGARLAIMPSIPAAAWLIAEARAAYKRHPRVEPALGLIVAWLAFSGVILATVVSGIIDRMPAGRSQVVSASIANKQPCLLPSAFADLRGLPPERMMTPIDLGSHMLLYTPHSVVAAPYHRNQDGVLDAFRFFGRSSEEARAMAQRRGLTMVVTCPAMPEMQGAGVATQGTLLYDFANNTLPDWVTEVPNAGPLKVYTLSP